MKPEITSKETIYRGHMFDLEKVCVRQDEKEFERDIIRHPGSAVIVPIYDDGKIALVSQFRVAANKFLLELPAGTINAGETAFECARRELTEEIGVVANSFTLLVDFYVSPGFLDETMSVFMATDLSPATQTLDDDEILSIEVFSFEQCFEMIKNGEIIDAKTIAGVLLASARLDKHF
ncbi:MAG: NUDIX hydrolase [Pyrinomonadaceae bacterium]